MSHLLEIVDTIEVRINTLLKKQQSLKETCAQLEEEIKLLKKEQHTKQLEVRQWKEESENLKVVNAMLGSNEYKRETKLKINSLIREIDQCILNINGA